jgi:hypothetical protein
MFALRSANQGISKSLFVLQNSQALMTVKYFIILLKHLSKISPNTQIFFSH